MYHISIIYYSHWNFIRQMQPTFVSVFCNLTLYNQIFTFFLNVFWAVSCSYPVRSYLLLTTQNLLVYYMKPKWHLQCVIFIKFSNTLPPPPHHSCSASVFPCISTTLCNVPDKLVISSVLFSYWLCRGFSSSWFPHCIWDVWVETL